MAEVFGTFILTRNDDNYTAEFFNNHSDNFIQELVNVTGTGAGFAGIYRSQWQERNSQYTSDLQIIAIGNNLFNLIWNNIFVNNERINVIYVGRGVSRGNTLTTVYLEARI